MRVRSDLRILAALVLLAPAAPAVAQASLERSLDAKLDSLYASGHFPGATFAVALADGSVIGLAVGQSDTASHTAMKPTDRMLAGSTGKTFFAAVALQLVAERRLGLDDPISKYLGAEPWFGRLPNAADITIRMLMNHTSGLVRYEFRDEFTRDLTADPYRVWKPEEQIAYILDTQAPFAAGRGWEYSDTNYIVLAMIMERITGTRMYDEIRRRITGPLRLDDVIPQEGPSIPGLVQGYAGPQNPFGGKDAMLENGRLILNPQFEWAGGGFAVTSTALARWARALYRNEVFDARLDADVFDGRPARGLGRGARYGLGVIILDTPLGPSWGHSGFFPGYLTEMRYYPDHGFAVAIQVNTSAGRPFPRGQGAALQELAEIVAASARRE